MPSNEFARLHRLSPMQHGMLYHYLSDPHSGVDLEQIVCELNEPLDPERLAAAWNRVAARHQVFRTRFRWEGVEQPTQEVLAEIHIQPAVLDWRGLSSQSAEREFEALLEEDRRRGFDLRHAPATRLALVRWDESSWRCVWSFPHILMDGRSFPIVLREVFDLYDDGLDDQLPSVPQYTEFLEWLERWDASADAAYWRGLLRDVRPTRLPGAHESAVAAVSERSEQSARLPARETSRVLEFASRAQITLNTMLQGAWALLLARYSGVDDVLFGATRACRRGTMPDADRVVGVFVNTVPVRVDCSPAARVGEWLRRLRTQQINVRRHEHTPLTDIQRWSGLGTGHPLFESLIVFDRASLDGQVHAERPSWSQRRFTLHERTPFPLAVYAYGGQELELKLAYDPRRVPDDGAGRVLGHLVTLIAELAKDGSRSLGAVPMLTEGERQRQLIQWNATGRRVDSSRCVHERVEAQVKRTPDRIAVADEHVMLTYRELDQRANRLAQELAKLGVQPDLRVGVCVERSVDLVVGVLAVLKAGGAYVPLDPEYPLERLRYMAQDAGLVALVAGRRAAADVVGRSTPVVSVHAGADLKEPHPNEETVTAEVGPHHLAYVIYTSGSTGKPKGVMVEHRNVVNFFAAMDERIPRGETGSWLAVTSLSFDISVLELLWPLTRGFRVVVANPLSGEEKATGVRGGPAFSLFYFASAVGGAEDDQYRLLIEGARFADDRGFHAVWTPERHFHAFGGLYPNPALTGAAVAAVTRRVGIRAGSVVLPLHQPLRIAEEWALVDNLSRGRVGISFASGWQPNDFVLAPENYADRKRLMLEGIELVRRLWRGESVTLPGPDGRPVEVRTFPRPVQPELPVWITTAGGPETYRAAGEAGARVLTHLLGQTVEDLSAMIALYREAWHAADHPGDGYVTLMLHTFVGHDETAVRETVREPMKTYLRSSVSLIKGFAGAWTAYRRGTGAAAAAGNEFDQLSPEDMESLLDFAFERYFETSGLFGTPERCLELTCRLDAAGVDEIACLIDFGPPTDLVLRQLEDLDAVRKRATRAAGRRASSGLPSLMERHGITHLQCTPSLARMLLVDPETKSALGRLQVMLVGGEPLPGALAAQLGAVIGRPVVNMYGPTETTIWSSTHEVVEDHGGTVPIGRPIANTRFYVLDGHGQPVPVGVPGELYIGGAGVVRGYLGRPELTAERFVRDPFAHDGERLYRTGDLVRWRADGVAEFLGRTDHQVKIRGHRIEPGEIEAVLAEHPDVGEVVVNTWQRGEGDAVLVAYVVPADGRQPTDATIKTHARQRLPEVMVPAHVVFVGSLPLTPNKKVDRRALPTPDGESLKSVAEPAMPATPLEELVADVWRSVLGAQRVGRDDRFFELGGNSLTTIQVAMRIREALGIELPLRAIFEASTVAELAAELERRLVEGADPNRVEQLLRELERIT